MNDELIIVEYKLLVDQLFRSTFRSSKQIDEFLNELLKVLVVT